jgi:hypothetical protein
MSGPGLLVLQLVGDALDWGDLHVWIIKTATATVSNDNYTNILMFEIKGVGNDH